MRRFMIWPWPRPPTFRCGTTTSDILAIGDGPETDILGAANQGFPVVYVGGGVRDHAEDIASELAHIRSLVPHGEYRERRAPACVGD